MNTIQIQERGQNIYLQAKHSILAFSLDEPGFRLLRDDRLLLHTGPGWGDPDMALSQWSAEGAHAILIYNRGSRSQIRLAIALLEDGWRLAWEAITRDTFEIHSGVHWYGQGELVNQIWPLEKISLWESTFMTWDNGPTGLCCVQEPLWITSTGAALILDTVTNQTQMGFNAPPGEISPPGWGMNNAQSPASQRPHPALPGSTGLLTFYDPTTPLSYQLLVGNHAVDVFQHVVKRLPRPQHIPPVDLIRAPIWTTWAEYKTDIDQDRVIAFARAIREHGFPGSTLEIDDRWQREYGDTELDLVRFPDPAGMVKTLNKMGFGVTVWVIPFIRDGAANTEVAIRNGFLVRHPAGYPYEVTWWQGKGYLLDVSNHAALDWWAGKLSALQEKIGLAGYKFDAGEACFLPDDAITHQPMTRNEYSQRWAAFGSSRFPYSEVRCGWRGQGNSSLVRHWDKFSTWGPDNGLASVVTTALALSMCGYPFLMPDMIGGNAYGEGRPDRELMIRWVQASAPMLAIQFSIAPWTYDAEVIDICRKYAQLHVDLADTRIEAAQKAVETGIPPIRPIFWLAPEDHEAQPIADAYLLGDSTLIAPVIQPGARSRDIYLPQGHWRDYWTGHAYKGGHWLRDFPAPLDALPMFQLQKE